MQHNEAPMSGPEVKKLWKDDTTKPLEPDVAAKFQKGLDALHLLRCPFQACPETDVHILKQPGTERARSVLTVLKK